jgi:hypothetical protein
MQVVLLYCFFGTKYFEGRLYLKDTAFFFFILVINKADSFTFAITAHTWYFNDEDQSTYNLPKVVWVLPATLVSFHMCCWQAGLELVSLALHVSRSDKSYHSCTLPNLF